MQYAISSERSIFIRKETHNIRKENYLLVLKTLKIQQNS